MTNQIFTSGLRFYQSANADGNTLKDDFVIRIQEYEIIMEDIRRNPMKGSVQHYLLLGRRGSGKSTLLKRLQIEIESDEQLRRSYIPINLAEEQANIYRLFDLFEEVIQELESKGIDVVYPELEEDPHLYTRQLITTIHSALEKSNKKIILLLDNIDRIFENLQDDTSLMRELLLNYDDIKIIGGSTRMTEHFWKYTQPFYEFFRVLELKPLTSEEIKRLMLHWSEKLELPSLKEFVEKRTGQLETIRILTDGLPRTLQFFVNILLNRTEETGYEYLKLIMDHVTPLYQERLNNLPPAQRKIVLQMAFNWEAAGAKELSVATRMDNKVISAQLKQLIEKGIADKIETNTKNHLYRLSERFFNLWLIFTQGSPREKRRAKYLTIFLENFYDAEGLNNLALGHLKSLEEKKLTPDKAAIITKALAQSKYITSVTRDQLIDRTLQIGNINEELKKQMPPTIAHMWSEIEDLIKDGVWDKAIEMTNSIEQEDGAREYILGEINSKRENLDLAEEHYLSSLNKGFNEAANELGILYANQEKYDLAEKYWLCAIESGNPPALMNLAMLYENQEKYDLAEKFYLLSLEKGVENAAYYLAYIYWSQNKLELAEKYYLLAIKLGEKDAITSLAMFYSEQEQFEKAEKYYLLAIQQGNSDAMNNLASYYQENGNTELAEKYLLMAEQHGNEHALFNLGLLYSRENNLDLAEQYYLRAIANKDVEAKNNLAIIYKNQNKIDLAEHFWLKAAEEKNDKAMQNLAKLYEEQEKFELAVKYFQMAIEHGNENAVISLAMLYEDQKKYEQAEKLYLKAIENGNIKALVYLGELYEEQNKIKLAISYYKKAIKKGHRGALLSLALVYEKQNKPELANKYFTEAYKNDVKNIAYNFALFLYEQNTEKTKALELINKSITVDSDKDLAKNLWIIINTWVGEFNLIEQELINLIEKKHFTHLETTLIHLMFHHQINLVYKLFLNNVFGQELKERFQPLYYATTLILNKNTNIDLKIPPEIHETVNKLIKTIEEGTEFYYS